MGVGSLCSKFDYSRFIYVNDLFPSTCDTHQRYAYASILCSASFSFLFRKKKIFSEFSFVPVPSSLHHELKIKTERSKKIFPAKCIVARRPKTIGNFLVSTHADGAVQSKDIRKRRGSSTINSFFHD